MHILRPPSECEISNYFQFIIVSCLLFHSYPYMEHRFLSVNGHSFLGSGSGGASELSALDFVSYTIRSTLAGPSSFFKLLSNDACR